MPQRLAGSSIADHIKQRNVFVLVVKLQESHRERKI